MKKSLKIFFQACDGIGHINACIGLAQALANRGHRITFLNNRNFIGTFLKYGFDEIILDDGDDENNVDDRVKSHPIESVPVTQSFVESGFLSAKSSYDQLDLFDRHKNENLFCKLIYDDFKKVHEHMANVLKTEQPDLIVIDNSLIPPCIVYGQIPFIYSWSANPLMMFRSDKLPPMMSGFPTNDSTTWSKYSEKLNNTAISSIKYYQNLLNKDLGYPEFEDDKFWSAELIIYGYPEELDYTDIVPMPENCIRIDAFCRMENKSSQPLFELPDEFKNQIHPEDKLIYISLGSFGSSNIELMKKIINALSQTSHKYIVSKGQFHEQFDLATNMWGQPYLPQTQILPMVDMVITHGGNNTVTETFSFGKPMLVIPLVADQHDNAQRIQEKGYGYRLNQHNFTADELIQLVNKIINDNEMIEKCRKAGERIRNDSDSKMKACERIEQFVEQKKAMMMNK
ncbi:NDP-glycosyltransferase YjiC-like [Dermatophagoides pteronyssinus]|uniref:NDP-glycosyltransferase YjiC-like n=1 Tax=Dermatophagoides pteronyssinus TaxID=6956 RepID=UPI003F66B19B